MRYRHWFITLVSLLLLLLSGGPLSKVSYAQGVPPGGAPPAGSGPVDLNGFIRVIDGDTIDTWINGSRVGIGLIGINAPMGNTKCGQDATGRLQALMHAPVRLEEDPDLTFDERKRRMYYAFVSNGQSVALELVASGYAHASGQGKEKDQLAAAEADARQNKRGCLWRGASATSNAEAEQSFESGANAAVAATSLPTNFTQDVVASGLGEATAFAFLPDGRILIAQKAGVVRIYKNGSVLSTPFIDISSRVNAYWDRGLLGIAADPNFASNGLVYLLYAYENDPAQYTGTKTARLTRVTASGDSASPSSEVTLLGKSVGSSCKNFPAGADCIPADWYGHSVGHIKFSQDGTMFMTNGDAATWNLVDDDALRAQDLDSLAGKILRITNTGAGVSTNPFWNGSASANRSKVWGYGLRNAYRFGLRPSATLPYLGDVGWNEWEEINVGTAGVNMGWPCYEGGLRQIGYEPKSTCQSLYNQGSSAVRVPLISYSHNNASAAVTAGTFYTGTTYPSIYQGAYFYGDYAIGYIRYFRVDNNNNLLEGPLNFATGADGPVDIQMGPDGNLYYLAINTGELRRIRYTASTPTATPTSSSGSSQYLSDRAWSSMTNGWGPVEKDMSNGEDASGDGRTITLNGQTYSKGLGAHAASDVRYALGGNCSAFQADVGVDDEVGGNGSVVFQVWADGTKIYDSGLMTASTATKSVNVNLSGKQELALIVTDGGDGVNYDHGDWANARVSCGTGTGNPTPTTSSNQAPTATITQPASTLRYKVGDVINYSGSATDPEDGTIPASGLAWQIIVHHCPGGSCHTHSLTTGSGASGSFTVPDHGDDSHLEIILTATDSGGRTGTKSVILQPQTVTLTLATSPSGLQVIYGSESGISPMTRTTIVGSSHTIYVPSPQGNQTFVSWSDGGAQQHDITVGASNVTYTATFTTTSPPTATPTSSSGSSQYLSDRGWSSMTNGWGPVEKDMSNGEDGTGDGRTITLNGQTYTKGLGAHAVSEVHYPLGGSCSTFQADVGVDDEVGNNGSVVFQVWADGAQLYDSGLMTGSTATKNVNVNISGKQDLVLIVTDGGDGIPYDHADWANARVSCGSPGPGDTTPPTVTSTKPSNGASNVARSVNVTATFSEAMDPSSLNTSTVIIVKDGTTTPIAGIVTYDPATNTVTLDPSANLDAAAKYVVTVKAGASGAKDLAGNPLVADKVWSFMTRRK